MNGSRSEDGLDMRRRRFLGGATTLTAMAIVAPAWSADAPSEATVSVEKRGDEIVVEAHAEVHAASTLAWLTLVDYDRLSEFIPGMSVSRTVSRQGTKAVIEQTATATFGPFRQDISLRLAVEETPDRSVTASIVQGDFRRFDSRYDVVSLDAGRTRVDFHAILDPIVPLPPLVGVAVMRSQIRAQFEAMMAEIGRRGAYA